MLALLAQARAEVDAVMGDRAAPSVEDFMALRYVMRCVNESMRLYPHPPVLLRRAQVADTLPGAHARPFKSLFLAPNSLHFLCKVSGTSPRRP